MCRSLFSVILCYTIICLRIIVIVWAIFNVKYNIKKSKVYPVTYNAGTEGWGRGIPLLFL